jgi:AraC-like DNA-binding protein
MFEAMAIFSRSSSTDDAEIPTDAGSDLVGTAGGKSIIRTISAAMSPHPDHRQDFLNALGRPFLGEELFDRIADTVFFLKDRAARYVAVNQTLVRRCGLPGKADLLGRTAREIFPAPLGQCFDDQDRRVLREGLSIDGRLELHLSPGGRQGWCLTWKEPLTSRSGQIIGISGISRDVPAPASPRPDMTALSATLAYVHDHLDAPLRIPDLAARAQLSAFRFDQRVRALFGLSAKQYLIRARIELACNRLRQTEAPISRVAQECGFADQAAFTRQFHKSAGLTPKAYRNATAGARRD